MSDINRVQICGRLGAEPRIVTFDNGDQLMNLSVATSERWKDKKSGEWQEITQWHSVAIRDPWKIGRLRELRKGDTVYIEGTLVYRKYTNKDGVEQFATDIKVGNFHEARIITPWPKDEDKVTPRYQRSNTNGPVKAGDAIEDEIRRRAEAHKRQSGGLDDDIPF